MGVAGWKVVRDLRRNREQRLLIQKGAAEREHQVGGARTQSGQHDAGLSAQLSVHRRRDAGIGLVPHQDEIDSDAAEFIHQDENFASR